MSSKAGAIDVSYVAQLARLELDESEKAAMQHDMEAIVEYIDELSELDVSGVEPTAHAVQVTNVERDDVARPGFGRDVMLANAPALIDGELIKVPQVLPGEGMN